MKALGIYFLVNLITISLLFSQQGISDYQFVTIDQELSQNTVSAMAQDQEGFLWIGSRSGLNRYDGINMVSFMHDERDSTSLCNNYIRSLYIGTNNRVFVGSLAGGYCIYNETDGTFGKLPTAERYPELDHVTVNAFYEDQKGNIWIATERKGLFMWRAQDQVIVQYRHNENDSWGISSNTVTGVIGDGRGNLWVSTWGGGLNLFDTNTKRFIHYRHDEKDANSPYSNIIRCMTGGSDGHIWLGTDRGVDRVSYDDRGKYRFEHMVIKSEEDEEPFVLDLIEDKKQRLWIGSENHGLGILDTDDGAYHWYTVDSKKEYSIKNNSIWSLFEDQKGVIWVGTFNKGIFKLDEGNRKFPVYKHNPYDETSLTHNAVSSFYEDKKGNVWIGTDGGGLDYWDTEAESFTHYRKDEYPQMSNQVLSVMIDSQENVWVGNWQGGALVKRKGSSTFKKFKLPPGIKVREGRENVFSIREDKEGKLWFAVFRSGIQVYDPKTETFEVFTHDEDDEQSLSSNLTRYIFEDSKGRFWIGTEGGGLNVLEDPSTGVFRRFNHSADDTTTISDNTVQCVLEDNQGNIWVGTSGGVNLYNPENDSFTRYGYDEGFADVVIHSILSDDKGMLWMSTNKGLVRFDPETGKVRNFDLNDGLQSMEFFKHSSFKLSTGALLFGGVDGFNVIHPAQVSDVFEEPKVYLVDFKVSNESIKNMAGVHLEKGLIEGGQVRLNYDQNDFDFEFAQINFSQTSKNEYAYRLKNYDKTWQQAGNRREAYYTNVPPGSYTFEVRGTDNGGEWSSQEASFSLVVDPPWYASVWAYVLYSMFLLGVLYWAFQVIINRERLQTKLMVEHMELSKMQELDQMKSSFFANISHEFRSPLTLILGPLKAMIEKKNYVSNEEQVHMMLRNAENLLNLINQLLELSKLESGKMRLELVTKDVTAFLKPIVHSFSSLASRNNMAYKVVMPKGAVELSFDKDKLEKIVVNLLSNAFKYTNDYGKVTVSLREEEDKVVLEVKDDGIGIPQEDQDYIFNRYYRVRDHKSRKSKGTGIGLSLTKELVELHHGHIAFKSEENEGTSFEVHLFKGTMHFEAEDFELEDEQVAPISANQGIYEIEESLYKSASSNDQIAEEEDKKLPLILVTEDNTDIRLYIKSILEEEYRVIQAEDGNDGVSKAQEFIPDLIISDVMMPGKDGLELCEEIKSNVKTSHIPVILLTAKASNDSALTGFELGADYYITKPFNPKLLSLRVRNALKTRDQIRGQLLNKSTFNINPKNVKIASRDEEFIAKAVAVIEENISNSEFYVDDLGRELGMSRMQLYRKLKGLIGQSANEFIRSIRLKRAAQLIRQDELNISEITYQVGFNDLQYFRDCFKKQYGVNPSEYAHDVKEKIN